MSAGKQQPSPCFFKPAGKVLKVIITVLIKKGNKLPSISFLEGFFKRYLYFILPQSIFWIDTFLCRTGTVIGILEKKMTEPLANNDGWDDVINYEENAYNCGKRDGIAAAVLSHKDGVETGVAKGYSFGLEVGFIEYVATQAIQKYLVSGEQSSSNRLSGRLETIIRKCRAFPDCNNENVDHVALFEEIRGLYKACVARWRKPRGQAVESVLWVQHRLTNLWNVGVADGPWGSVWVWTARSTLFTMFP